jgi:hypothetical protein
VGEEEQRVDLAFTDRSECPALLKIGAGVFQDRQETVGIADRDSETRRTLRDG